MVDYRTCVVGVVGLSVLVAGTAAADDRAATSSSSDFHVQWPTLPTDEPTAYGPDEGLSAGEAADARLFGIISELRLGVGYHDVVLGDPTRQKNENGVDINIEALFLRPRWGFLDADQTALRILLEPRPHIGGTINTVGDTSHGYFGLTWGDGIGIGAGYEAFSEAFLGFSVHNGTLEEDDPLREPEVTDFGSRVLFRLGLDVGYRNVNGHGISVFWEHLSNGNILTDGSNEGLDTIGIRYGYRFDALFD